MGRRKNSSSPSQAEWFPIVLAENLIKMNGILHQGRERGGGVDGGQRRCLCGFGGFVRTDVRMGSPGHPPWVGYLLLLLTVGTHRKTRADNTLGSVEQ